MATTSDERMKILQMLEDGKIAPEDAATLLRALDGGRSTTPTPLGPGGENRYLRIQVTNLNTGKPKVNVTLPMALVGAGLRMAERFAPDFEGMDMQQLEEILASGIAGKFMDVMDEEDNERVEIFVE
jgi:hypothetical protein